MEYIVYNFSSSTATQLTIPLILSASRSSWFCCVKGFSRMGFDTVAIRPRLPAKEVPFIPTFATNRPLHVVVGARRGTALEIYLTNYIVSVNTTTLLVVLTDTIQGVSRL